MGPQKSCSCSYSCPTDTVTFHCSTVATFNPLSWIDGARKITQISFASHSLFSCCPLHWLVWRRSQRAKGSGWKSIGQPPRVPEKRGKGWKGLGMLRISSTFTFYKMNLLTSIFFLCLSNTALGDVKYIKCKWQGLVPSRSLSFRRSLIWH